MYDYRFRKVYCKVSGLDVTVGGKINLNAVLLVEGGNTNDLPQVKHRLIRGVKGYEHFALY